MALDVFTELQSASSLPAVEFHGETSTIRVLDWLHIALVTIDLTGSTKVFEPERTYSYNLKFSGGVTGDLRSLNLLADRATPRPHLALGYQTDALPSFVLPPRQLTDLRILHASCRRPNAAVPDAMRWMDDLIRTDRADPKKRPHQLFLTGDQIYADDVDASMLAMLMEASKAEPDFDEQIPTRFGAPSGQTFKTWPGNLALFPPRFRKNVTMHDARFSSTDGTSHLITFGEFCAMHLFVWCNELWPDTPPLAADRVYANLVDLPPEIWRLHLGLLGANPSREEKEDVEQPVGFDDDDPQKPKDFTTADINKIMERMRTGEHLKSYNDDVAVIQTFRAGLPKVRRVLANVPTYMIFDDHEVTDDWNFSAIWRDRVLTSPLGRTIVRNGMLAYALFQGWGNDPRKFAEDVRDASGVTKPGPNKELLQRIPQLFPKTLTNPPHKETADAIDLMLGLGGDPDPKVRWNYSVPGQKHLAVALDVRTRRTFATHVAPPGNLSDKALKDQVPAAPLSPEIEVVVLISSLTVLGPPIFDAVFAPLAYRLFDIGHGNHSDIPGMNPDAIEAWPNDEVAMEKLLAALAPLRKVVILSGDVHFSASSSMSYWTKRDAAPARFAQFISSGARNKFKDIARKASESFAFMQKIIQFGASPERLGWNKSAGDLVVLPAGKQPSATLDRRLQQSPALLPTLGWPEGTKENPARPPDFAWRVDVVRDPRKDSELPLPARPSPLVPESPGQDVQFNLEGYRRVVVRHAKQLDKLNHTRQLLFASNYGLVYFTNTNGLAAVQDLFAAHPGAVNPDAPDVFTRHVIPLVAPAGGAPKIG